MLPMVTLAADLEFFLLLAAVGAPQIALWVPREFPALRRSNVP